MNAARQDSSGAELFDMDAFTQVKAAARRGAAAKEGAPPLDDADFHDDVVDHDADAFDDAAAGAAAAADVAAATGSDIEPEANPEDLPNPRRKGDPSAAALLLEGLTLPQRAAVVHRAGRCSWWLEPVRGRRGS